MELIGERWIAAPLAVTWEALNDPATLKACIASCESLERTAPDTLAAVLALKVGPVSARMRGTLKMHNVQAPHRYAIAFDGQGGVAGFGKGTAEVTLSEDGTGTRLRYTAHAQVGGRLAQVGSRLIDAVAARLAEDFFSAFEARLEPAPQAAFQAEGPVSAAPRATGMQWSWLLWAVGLLALAWLLLG
ncbi:MAG: hypothetical protein JWQ76_4526 [Ramlibacter sp.]|nr:hypothetical protein [Ramlibacter sp.]